MNTPGTAAEIRLQFIWRYVQQNVQTRTRIKEVARRKAKRHAFLEYKNSEFEKEPRLVMTTLTTKPLVSSASRRCDVTTSKVIKSLR